MKRFWGTTLSLSIAAIGTANGQSPSGGSGKPAVRISAIRSNDAETPVVRAQAPMPAQPMPILPPMGSGSGSVPLNAPRSFGSGPSVTEMRGGIPAPVIGGGMPSFAPPMGSYNSPQNAIFPPLGGAYEIPPVAHGGDYNQGQFLQQTGPIFNSDSSLPTPHLDAPLAGGAFPNVPVGIVNSGPVPYAAPLIGQNSYNNDLWWTSAEYLLWWTKSAQFPALLTTSSPSFNGILGTGDTRVLVGDGSFGQTLHSGGRFGVGRWFGDDQRWAAEGNIFVLGRNGEQFQTNSAEFPLIARPFNNLNQNISFSELVTFPGLSVGGATVNYRNSAWGGEFNIRRRLASTNCSRLDLLGGFRYLRVDEDLTISEQFLRTPNSPLSIGTPNAVAGVVSDRFRTENEFYGAQVGLQGELRRGRWYSNLVGKIALGTVYQTSQIEGSQQILFNNAQVGTTQGGLLALPGNIGTSTQNKFAVLPEIGLNIGYHITPYCRFFVGYNFMYLSSALRPGDQIDNGLDVARIPNFPVPGTTPLPFARPAVRLADKDYFVQGLSFGFQWRW